jgi:ABC-type multidrug transport system ATPase subunit
MVRTAAVERRCAVMMTSHSIEDATALCQRVGVMVDGALLCLGSPQHLRTRHGKHLTLTVHPRSPATATATVSETEEEVAEAETAAVESKSGMRSRLDAFIIKTIPGAVRLMDSSGGGRGGGGGGGGCHATFSAHTDKEAAAVVAAAAVAAEVAAETSASLTWDLPASAVERLPEILEALEAVRGGRTLDVEGYAVGQASLEDVFLDFAQQGAEQSDAQLMALDDALLAYRKGLSSRTPSEPASPPGI